MSHGNRSEKAALDVPDVPAHQVQMAMDSLRSEQNLMAGAVSGTVAAIAGAGIWALVTVVTEYQIGWMAVAIGFLVGFAIRLSGKGIDPAFGFVGAVLALVGCALGNVLTIVYLIADAEEMTFIDVAVQLNPMIIYALLIDTFEFMDVLFYGLAVYFGYKYAFREVTQDEFNRALGKAP